MKPIKVPSHLKPKYPKPAYLQKRVANKKNGRYRKLSKKNRLKIARNCRRLKAIDGSVKPIIQAQAKAMGDDFQIEFVKKFVFEEPSELDVELLCSRFRIGSSNVYKMIKEGIGIRDAHGDYFSGQNRVLGNNAEEEVERLFSNYIEIKHPFLVSKEFPFICATPDFVAQAHDEPPYLIEVKSGAKQSEANQNSKSHRSKVQVMASLQVFGLEKAHVVPVIRPKEDEVLGKYQILEPLAMFSDNYLFRYRNEIIDGYVDYLTEYFEGIYMVDTSDECAQKLRQLIDDRVPKRHRSKPTPTIEDIRDRLEAQRQKERVKCPTYGRRVPHNL